METKFVKEDSKDVSNQDAEQVANQGRIAFLLDGLLPAIAEALNEKIEALSVHTRMALKNDKKRDNPTMPLEIMMNKEKIDSLALNIQNAYHTLLNISTKTAHVGEEPNIKSTQFDEISDEENATFHENTSKVLDSTQSVEETVIIASLEDLQKSEKEGEPYCCPICQKVYKSARSLYHHRSLCGKLNKPSKQKKGNHICNLCGVKFNQAFKLRKHTYQEHCIIEDHERNYVCKTCDQWCKSQSALRMHETVHTGEKKFSCGYCEKQFTQKGNLKSHEKTHIGKKPFSCRYCDKNFKHARSIKSHEIKHSLDIKPV